MDDGTRAMRKAIFDREIVPDWKNRLLNEITPNKLRQLCAKVKDRGAPATANHVREIVGVSWPRREANYLRGQGHPSGRLRCDEQAAGDDRVGVAGL
jgi:hypothetical protein